ncbi:SLBB domain-containing protein [Draconibacterium halophilum]|uniref:Capsule biosynthesis protein n=1 Tax=Draconibacterium halophilum TaxID=2706887 RepID=A0A6C0RHI1_9BACT|nr:SLBB domain-containing protein [Draconibacterium halophilum]QIA08551.1 capsule biosynthesis protein [Draconibacterium halophilum]
MRINILKYSWFILMFLLLLQGKTMAQGVDPMDQNVSEIKSSQISDAQMRVIMQRAIEAGMTPEQIESLARSRGMAESEVEKFKERVERLYDNKLMDEDSKGIKVNTRPKVEYPENLEERLPNSAHSQTNPNFGFSLFKNTDLTFEPSFNVLTPRDYIIGPGDLLNIDVWGASQHSYQEVVSNEGSIIISNIGPVFLSGMSKEEAGKKLKTILSRIYSGLKDGKTSMKVTLGAVRSIQINIVGEVVLPGTYNISAMATAFNAMYIAGGPAENGSIRDVQIIRNNKIVAHIDFYEYLLNAQQSNNIRLQDQDIIFIPAYENRVSINGEVKRPMSFDIKPDESLDDLIGFAGGFTGNAYTERIKIIRNTSKEKRILDIAAEYLDAIRLENGDEVYIDAVLHRFENRVYISGAVFRPGIYAIDESTSLKELIKKADGLREDVFKDRISVFRLQDDLTREHIAVDLNNLLASNLDFTLQREDSIHIPSIHDLRETRTIQIEGEVMHPGIYPYSENTKVEDLIIQAGGLLETASTANIEIARRLSDNTSTVTSVKLADIIKFPIDKSLAISDAASNFILKPFDQVFVRKSPAYIPQMLVSINGEVNFPGKYSITSRTERVSDLIKRSGGITTEAYINGASLIRKKTQDKTLTDKAIDNITMEKESSNNINIIRNEFDIIALDLASILSNPGGNSDLILQEGDSIRILKSLQTIKVSGSVYNPNVVPFDETQSVKEYLSNAGGLTKRSKPGHIYVVYANGSVKKTQKTLFGRKYPELQAGAEIIVPSKGERRKMSPTGAISLVASISLIIVSLINAR